MDGNSFGLEFVLGIEVTRVIIANRFSCGFVKHLMSVKTSQAVLTLLVGSARVRQVWLGTQID